MSDDSKKLKIAFSHRYEKMPFSTSHILVRLFGVFRVKLEELPQDFLEWDTRFWRMGNVEHYELPKKGEYLLLLVGYKNGEHDAHGVALPCWTLFTTIRRWRKNKEEYYQSKIGSDFEVQIDD
jgi:hypothetical protein